MPVDFIHTVMAFSFFAVMLLVGQIIMRPPLRCQTFHEEVRS